MLTIRSIYIWFSTSILILIWFVLMLLSYLFDRGPVYYRTGFLFRKLGKILTNINPTWKLYITGENITDPRRPYVVVCNHQSLADIPLISNLPWEMKWMGKEELFKIPIIGWMMHLSADISVDRHNARSGALALLRALHMLEQKCSIMIFPEGTRSVDGRVHQFTDGAFHLALKAKVPILPLALDGSINCIPKNNWKFGEPSEIFLKVLPPIETSNKTMGELPALRETVRNAIMKQVAEWRSVPIEEVDGSVKLSSA